MEKDRINEKTCQNCRYYSQHYSKQGTRYNTVHCGHCLHRNVINHKARSPELCEYWEDIILKKEKQKRDIKEAIITISERLDELTIILKDDMET